MWTKHINFEDDTHPDHTSMMVLSANPCAILLVLTHNFINAVHPVSDCMCVKLLASKFFCDIGVLGFFTSQ